MKNRIKIPFNAIAEGQRFRFLTDSPLVVRIVYVIGETMISTKLAGDEIGEYLMHFKKSDEAVEIVPLKIKVAYEEFVTADCIDLPAPVRILQNFENNRALIGEAEIFNEDGEVYAYCSLNASSYYEFMMPLNLLHCEMIGQALHNNKNVITKFRILAICIKRIPIAQINDKFFPQSYGRAKRK
ncbi:MAG TPA: hypothetical protein VFJ43_06805 [Bacteroidia bacterium]|nr:hypothetical protein [Bacteroidia bacterium]